MIKYIKGLYKSIQELYKSIEIQNKTIEELTKKTKEHNDNFNKMFPNNLTSMGNATIGIVATENTVINILDGVLIKDYFTKEFINKEATTTKELYVIDGKSIKKEYYKEIDNHIQGDEWFYFNGKEYYFIK